MNLTGHTSENKNHGAAHLLIFLSVFFINAFVAFTLILGISWGFASEFFKRQDEQGLHLAMLAMIIGAVIVISLEVKAAFLLFSNLTGVKNFGVVEPTIISVIVIITIGNVLNYIVIYLIIYFVNMVRSL